MIRKFNQKTSIAKLLLTLILVSMSAVCGFAQGRNDKVSVSIKDLPLLQAIEKFEKATNYTFFYYANTIDLNKNVSLEAKALPVREALAEMLAKTGIRFEISSRQIVLIPERMEKPKEDFITVKGVVTVKGTGERLAGVAIVVEGSSVNTITNAMGEFSIKAPSNGVLDCSMLGMIPVNMPVLGRTSIPVLMEEDIQSLQGVVVTGYQTLSRDRATGSFGSINAESMENKPLVSVASVLEGKVAGLSVDSYGKLSIRGVSTFIAGKEPLIVVDGFPVEQSLYDSDLFQNKDGVLEGLNPDNIESITVLKDAVAASIYGARAANGVVVVVTRKGQQGGTKVSYKGTFSAKTQPRTKDLHFASVNDIIDAQLELYNSLPVYSNPYYYPYVNAGYYKWMADNGFMSQDEATSQIGSLRKNDFFKEVDKYLFRPELTQQHNLQISGGNEKDLYNVSANYTGTRGNFKYASDRKLTVDVRNDWRFNQRVSLSMSMNVNYSSNDSPILNPAYGGTMFDYKYFSFLTPYTSFVDANGKAKSYNPVVPFIMDTYSSVSTLKDMSYNLLENLKEETYHSEDFQARINAILNIKIFDGLSLDLGGNWQRGNYMYRQLYTDKSFYARRVYNNGISLANNATHVFPDGGIINEKRNINQSWTARAQLNYDKEFANGDHKLNAIAGIEIRQTTYNNNSLPTRYGYNTVAGSFEPMDIKGWNAGDYAGQLVSIGGAMETISPSEGSISYMDNRYVSYYANASYELFNKYILTGSVRMDLTNFFGTDPKYRYRPIWSLGGTWKLGDEEFFKVDNINRLDLRASYGINGNIALDQGPFLIIGVIDSYGGLIPTYSNYTQGTQYHIVSPANDQLRWEKTASTNIGIDLGMFNNRLGLSVDYYHKYSSDLLAPDNIDPTTGYTSLTINAGEIVNSGVEVSLNYDILQGSRFKWNAGFVFAYNKNMVKSYNVARPEAYYYLGYNDIPVEGYPTTSMWGLKAAGFDEYGEALCYNAAGEKIVQTNATLDDIVYLGQATPKFDLSLTNKFTFGNFDFSFMLVSKLGAKLRMDYFGGVDVTNRHVVDRWKQAGDETYYPAATYYGFTTGFLGTNDVFCKSADFLRLREANLGYNFDSSFVKKIGISNARVYVQGRNLFLITAKGVDIDPEAREMSSLFASYSGFSLPKELNIGLQLTF